MPRTSKNTASEVVDFGVAEDRAEHFPDGFTCSFTTIKADSDLAPLLKGLPGDSCHCPHWGYVFTGQITVRYGDRLEVFEPGDAFYMSPGHAPAAAAGSEFVIFSPTAELRVTEEHMAAAAQAIQAVGTES
jgi:hypothetical protein